MIRDEIRSNKYTQPTAGVMGEYLQVNVAIIPKAYADEFELFCNQNKKACPLIERSDVDLMLNDHTIEITRDIPKYEHFREGTKIKESFDLLDECLDDYVAFTLGCSFTFEKGLMDFGIELRHIEEKKNVAMFNTNISCESTNLFCGNMVVSMRPIKEKDIEDVISITSNYSKTHGIPIHIGNPRAIGIENIDMPDYGDSVAILDDELPVFWACGVTALNILRNQIEDIFYTHSPGHMLVTNTLVDDIKTFDVEEFLNGMMLRKTYYRGVSGLVYKNRLKEVSSKLLTYKHITLVTGFCIRSSMTGETDGPLGTMFLASALEKLGKSVKVITDEFTVDQLIGLKELLKLKAQVTVDTQVCQTDCIFSIERPGKNHEGRYHNMKGDDITDLVADTDTMIESYLDRNVHFIAMGDGGNEVGFGKEYDYVTQHIPNGEKICAKLIADDLLISGVSNWGCYVLIAMLSNTSNKMLLHSADDELKAMKCIVSLGAVDGLTGKKELSVDGYEIDDNINFLHTLHKTFKKQ